MISEIARNIECAMWNEKSASHICFFKERTVYLRGKKKCRNVMKKEYYFGKFIFMGEFREDIYAIEWKYEVCRY